MAEHPPRVGRPPSFQMVGSARRSGPKPQARSAVCEERANPRRRRLRRKYATPAARRSYPEKNPSGLFVDDFDLFVAFFRFFLCVLERRSYQKLR